MKFLRQIKTAYFFIFTFLLSGLMHLHIFQTDLVGYHVWRQTETQNNIENFYNEDFNILNPKVNDRGETEGIIRLEFPIMQWLFACFYRLFGDHLVISRILSFIIGVFSVAGIFFLIKNIFHNTLISLLGAWAFNFSPVFYYYTMNPLPDNFALCCSIWGLGFFFHWISTKSYLSIILTGVLLSLGVLAKLPFMLYLSVPAMYLIVERKIFITYLPQASIVLLFLLLPIIWYSNVIAPHWHPVVFGIFDGDRLPISTLIDIIQHNLISTLPELLINYGSLFFFIAGFYFIYKKRVYKKNSFMLFLIWGIAIILYFIFEMKIIAKVHDYYLLPFLPLIFIVVSYGCFHLLNSQNKFLMRFSIFLLCLLPVTAYLRANSRWNLKNPGFNVDLLIYKNELRNAVPGNALCIAGNDQSTNIFFYYIHKKGWSFDSNVLDSVKIKMRMDQGAEYLYSDSREVEEKSEVRKFLDSLIMQKGSIRVYKLKRNNPLTLDTTP